MLPSRCANSTEPGEDEPIISVRSRAPGDRTKELSTLTKHGTAPTVQHGTADPVRGTYSNQSPVPNVRRRVGGVLSDVLMPAAKLSDFRWTRAQPALPRGKLPERATRVPSRFHRYPVGDRSLDDGRLSRSIGSTGLVPPCLWCMRLPDALLDSARHLQRGGERRFDGCRRHWQSPSRARCGGRRSR